MEKATVAWTTGWLVLSALSASLLGCEQVQDACDIGCGDEGVLEGNASITGVKSLDGFFAAVIRFDQKAAQVSGRIDGELRALAADFGVDAAMLQARFQGDVAAALRAQFEANFAGEVTVRAEPPRCDVDARAELSASAECQVEAGCDVDVDPGKATLACKGRCEADVNAQVDCGANAELSCTFRGPAVACSTECKGTCSAQLAVGARCEGRCEGECDVALSEGGRCEGMCKGSCVTEANAGVECSGTCSGECTARGPMANCMGAAEVHCEAMGDASVMCSGECQGELEPPMAMVQCEASATCNAQAKADASVEVQCSEPALDIDYTLRAGLDASVAAQMELGMRQLQVRLPRVLASLEQARLLIDASAELGASAGGAAEGTVRAFAGGDLNAVAAVRVAQCAPAQFQLVPGMIAASTGELRASFEAAAGVNAAVGL